MNETRRIDKTGLRVGRLVVLSIADCTPNKKTKWLCQCDCGKQAIVHSSNLTRGHTQSCGCLQREVMKAKLTKHGHSLYRKKQSREYKSWQNMKLRCLNPRNNRYRLYGARGIKVCDRWLASFVNFLSDMGSRPPETSLDRINCDGNYEPQNCRWATAKQQAQNRRKRSVCNQSTQT